MVPSSCPYELVYSATLADNSVLPTAISLVDNSGTKTLRVYESDPAKTGVYTIKVKVLDPKTLLTNQTLLVDVTVKCSKTVDLVTNNIVSIFRLNEIDPPQLYSYTAPSFQINPSFCLQNPF